MFKVTFVPVCLVTYVYIYIYIMMHVPIEKLMK